MDCPGCGARMDEERLPGNYGRTVAIDVCHPCQGLWFDGLESLQLTPGSTLRLFALMHARRPPGRPPLAESLRCPRCRAGLVQVTDLQRATRFGYARCPHEHGRFIGYLDFLREKDFVRPLDPREVAELRRRVQAVVCSGCGAAVDLAQGSTCRYCQLPLSMLDPDQVERTVRALQAAEARRSTVDPMLPLKLMLDRLETERVYQRIGDPAAGSAPTGEGLSDLVEAGLAKVVEALRAIAGTTPPP